MPWPEFGGAAGPGGGGERAFPRPLGRRRGASSSACLAEGALGSSGVPQLAATPAPPAPLVGDRHRQRRRSDREQAAGNPAAGEAREAAGFLGGLWGVHSLGITFWGSSGIPKTPTRPPERGASSNREIQKNSCFEPPPYLPPPQAEPQDTPGEAEAALV